MGKMRSRIKSLLVTFAILLTATIGVTATLLPSKSFADSVSSYVEIYSPLGESEVAAPYTGYLDASVVSDSRTPSGSALALEYTPGNDSSVDITINAKIKSGSTDGYEGLAMWVDVPETEDEYSFTMFIVKSEDNWQTMDMGSPLTLISEDGTIEEVSSIWKRQQLNGFTGWVVMPKGTYPDAQPIKGVPYKIVIMIENAPEENIVRTEEMTFKIGSIGYYTNYNALLFEMAGEEKANERVLNEIDGYLEEINALVVKSDKQRVLKNKMLVYFSNVKENINKLPLTEKLELIDGLYDEFYARMEECLYGDIRSTDFIMSFALMSDTHFSSTWINERFLACLDDAKTIDPDLGAVFVLGDISNEGIAIQDPSKTELDNYYDWLDSYEYKNSKGEDIPIRNVLGNHDYRGPSFEGYPKEAYAPAIEMYLEREGVETLQWDMWLNGYHFIFLNSDGYHSDDCHLSNESLLWLDKTLAENEDGRPIFVMVHQPKDRVIAMEGATMTFEEVIARHPSAIVSSGHNHSAFGVADIHQQEGKGTFINQPAMVNMQRQYYFVELYEGGVIYRAREDATDSWVISSDVVVSNMDMPNNALFSSNDFNVDDLTLDGVTATLEDANTVTGSQLVLNGLGSAVIPVNAMGDVENYLGYSTYIQSENPVKLKINDKALVSGATYYVLDGTNLVEKTVSSDLSVEANGYVVIPKEAIDGDAYPNLDGKLEITVDGASVSIDKFSYYFDKEDMLKALTDLSVVFKNEDGSIYAVKEAKFNDSVTLPANPVKEETDQFTFEFVGWDIDGDGNVDQLPTSIKGNLSVTAVYVNTTKQYTYTFYDFDKEVLETETVDYGTSVVAPVIDGLIGWDIDGDGACESLPTTIEEDLIAYAVKGEKPYKNAEVLFDPSSMKEVPISTYSFNSAINLCSPNILPVRSENSPTGKVAQYTYNYTDGTKTQNGSVYVQIDIPYTGDVSNFQGYAIWLEISETTEKFVGGLKFNSKNLTDPVKNGWMMIADDGTISYADTKWEGQGTFPLIGEGFSGWVIIDKAIYASGIEPKADGNLYFQIKETGRTTPYTLGIGQVLMFSDKNALVSELTDVNAEKVLSYSFNDGNGYVYKSGQLASGESMVIPANPVHQDKDMFFAGWDIDEDGLPDTLPVDGKITKNFNAVALFYHVNAFRTINEGVTTGWAKDGSAEAGRNAMSFAASTSENLVNVSINANKDTLNTTGYMKLTLPYDEQHKGLAVWLDCTNQASFSFQLFKNWQPKQTLASSGESLYLYSVDGSIIKNTAWRKITLPTNFKGWMIIPLSVFDANYANLKKGDILRLGFPIGNDGNASDFNANFSIGEVVGFNCTVDTFIKQIDKKVYGFIDYDGSYYSAAVITENSPFVVPENPVREDWTFVGWDIDGDGVADTLPQSVENRNFKATAVYTRQFTYKFVDENNNVIHESTKEYGSLILPPFKFTPKTEDEQYIYTAFNGFKGYEEGMILTSDMTFEVDYEKTLKEYEVKFYDGTKLLSSSKIGYGQVITLPDAPTKDGYTFKGWQGYTDGMTVEGDISFTAIFEKNVEENEITPPDVSDKKGGCGSTLNTISEVFIILAVVSLAFVVTNVIKKRS